jgi:hypothetical protein
MSAQQVLLIVLALAFELGASAAVLFYADLEGDPLTWV